MRVFGLLQTLPGDFRSNNITSRWLPGHLRWRDVISCHLTASYCKLQPCGSEMYSSRELSSFYIPFQVTSGQMKSLPGHLWSPWVTWRHFLSRSCLLRDPQPCKKWNVQWCEFSAFYRHFHVNFGQMMSLPKHVWSPEVRDVISCHMRASYCELQPCRKWNAQYTWVFGILHAVPCDIRSNDVTSGSLLVSWGHVTSFPVTWLPPTASYRLVGSEMYSRREFSAFYIHFQMMSGQMTSLPVTWGHVTSFPVTWLPPPASYSLVGSKMYSIREFSAFYCHFQVTSSQMTSLPRQF